MVAGEQVGCGGDCVGSIGEVVVLGWVSLSERLQTVHLDLWEK